MQYKNKRQNQFIAGCIVMLCGIYCMTSVMVVAAPIVYVGYKIIRVNYANKTNSNNP